MKNDTLGAISLSLSGLCAQGIAMGDALDVAAEIGAKVIDLGLISKSASILRADGSEIAALAKAVRERGLRVSGIETPLFRCPLRRQHSIDWAYTVGFSEDLTPTTHLWYLQRAFRIADAFGAEHIRCYGFWREYKLAEALNEVAEVLKSAAKIGATAGRTLLLQNSQDTMAGTGLELAEILKRVGADNLHASFNPAASARLGGNPFPDDFEALRGQIRHLEVTPQTVDVRSGWAGPPTYSLSGSLVGQAPFYFYNQLEGAIEGWVQIDDVRLELQGARTFVPLKNTVGINYASLLGELRGQSAPVALSLDTSNLILRESDPFESVRPNLRRVWDDVQTLRRATVKI